MIMKGWYKTMKKEEFVKLGIDEETAMCMKIKLQVSSSKWLQLTSKWKQEALKTPNTRSSHAVDYSGKECKQWQSKN